MQPGRKTSPPLKPPHRPAATFSNPHPPAYCVHLGSEIRKLYISGAIGRLCEYSAWVSWPARMRITRQHHIALWVGFQKGIADNSADRQCMVIHRARIRGSWSCGLA
ncbi:hypothetical protein LIA77_10910 [Sarocladium implicatum]|nr:hypothetical protein LIA77_10910 [Sarocladium implicatum]